MEIMTIAGITFAWFLPRALAVFALYIAGVLLYFKFKPKAKKKKEICLDDDCEPTTEERIARLNALEANAYDNIDPIAVDSGYLRGERGEDYRYGADDDDAEAESEEYAYADEESGLEETETEERGADEMRRKKSEGERVEMRAGAESGDGGRDDEAGNDLKGDEAGSDDPEGDEDDLPANRETRKADEVDEMESNYAKVADEDCIRTHPVQSDIFDDVEGFGSEDEEKMETDLGNVPNVSSKLIDLGENIAGESEKEGNFEPDFSGIGDMLRLYQKEARQLMTEMEDEMEAEDEIAEETPDQPEPEE